MKNVAFGNMENVSFQEKQQERIKDKSLHQPKFFVKMKYGGVEVVNV